MHKQQEFPKKLPMSQSVPQIYSQVKEFIYASLKFSESLHRRYLQTHSTQSSLAVNDIRSWCHFVSSSTEIDDMLRKSTNLLLTRILSGCLQNLIKKPHIGLTEVGSTAVLKAQTQHSLSIFVDISFCSWCRSSLTPLTWSRPAGI